MDQRFRSLEKLIEGEVIRVFANGVVDTEALKNEGMTVHELYGELRVHHVEQLGQVKSAYVEIDGELSVFFYLMKRLAMGYLSRQSSCDRKRDHGRTSSLLRLWNLEGAAFFGDEP